MIPTRNYLASKENKNDRKQQHANCNQLVKKDERKIKQKKGFYMKHAVHRGLQQGTRLLTTMTISTVLGGRSDTYHHSFVRS